jgi:hypothetical protein
MLEKQVLRTKEGMRGTCRFYHKRWYDVKYGLGVFRKGIVTNDDLHGKRCNQIFTQMSGHNIFFDCNMWFKIEEIKT